MGIKGRRSLRVSFAAALTSVIASSAAAEEASLGTLASSLHAGLGRGDFEFNMDVAATGRGSEGRAISRVLTQLPIRLLLDQADANVAEMRVQARAYDAERALEALARLEAMEHDPKDSKEQEAQRADRRVQEVLEDFGGVKPSAAAEVETPLQVEDRTTLRDTDYKLVELSFELAPGNYVFEVFVENLSRLKKGLLDRLRHKHTNATARMLVRVPDLHAAVALADPVFKVGHNSRQDYAARVYGLLNDSLHVHSTLYGSGSARVDMTVHDRAGEVHLRDSLEVALAGRHAVAFDASVNTLPAGQYVLALMAVTPDGAVGAQRSFDVAWSLSSWKKSRRDLDLEAEIVLTDKEYELYKSLPLGEKESYLDAFWERNDPSPDTAYNEVLEDFHRRVAHADANFSERVRGALTHRGKVFIRFGPPNEIQSEAVPSHLAGQGVEGLIEKVEDPYSIGDLEVQGNISESVRSPAANVRLSQEATRVVGPGRELVAYELWLYTGRGAPLLERDVVGIDTGFRLLFADTQGFGAFELRKSSATLDIPGLFASSF
ncbi:MAG: GWxTD domain-containing protein [Candidatus Latescibacterota bacterium]|nr:MAG: GWxTD domain-containing protein [Candidatus Latescibacterota bacterium]